MMQFMSKSNTNESRIEYSKKFISLVGIALYIFDTAIRVFFHCYVTLMVSEIETLKAVSHYENISGF